jgi:hypothetical protein
MLHFLGPALLGTHALSGCVPQPILPHSVLLLALQYGKDKSDVFNILWALVFGFATLNILGLVARRFEPERNRLSFGETLAVMVVLVSVVLLGWELLTLFKVFPIKLHPR